MPLSQRTRWSLVKTSEGRVDVVNYLSPLDTLRVARALCQGREEPEAPGDHRGLFNMRKREPVAGETRAPGRELCHPPRGSIRYAAKGMGRSFQH